MYVLQLFSFIEFIITEIGTIEGNLMLKATNFGD